MKQIYLILLSLTITNLVFAQNVGIGTSTPNASAKLDITDASRGVLLPRVALTATNIAAPVVAPATSLMVYNTATSGIVPNNVTPGFYYWNGIQWTRLQNGSASGDWTISGNGGTVAGTNFIGTTDAIDFVTRTSNAERMRVTSAGNVGIGVTGPTNKLDIAAAARSGTHGTGLPFYATGTVLAGSNGFEFRHDNGTQGIGLGFNTIYATGTNATQDLGLASRSTGNLNFTTNAIQRMTVLGTNGNVGIGIIAPTQRLDVQGGNARINNAFIGDVGHGAGWGGFSHSSQANTTGYALISSNDGAYTLINKQNTGGGYIGFRIGNNDVAVITNAGFMGVGTNVPNQKLSVRAGSIEISEAGDNTILSRNTAQARNHHMIGTYMGWDQGGIYLAGYNVNNFGGAYSNASRVYCGGAFGSLPITATAFTVASSKRYKENIVPVSYGLATILKLRPVQYQYNFDVLKQTRMGLIAEEVNEIIPEVVVKRDDKGNETKDINGETMGINYSELTPILIKAVQEQQQQIEELKKQNEELLKRIESIEKNN
jgi:hypothetical protein